MPKTRIPRANFEKFYPINPQHKNLLMIEDLKSTKVEEKCQKIDCKNQIASVAHPCGHQKLCNRCMALKLDNKCDKCEVEADEWISYKKFQFLQISKRLENNFEKCITENCSKTRSFCAFPCGCFGYCEDCKSSRKKLPCCCGRKITKFTKIYESSLDSFRCVVCYSNQGIIKASTCGHILCSSCERQWRQEIQKFTCPFCRNKKPIWTKIHYRNHIEKLKD